MNNTPKTWGITLAAFDSPTAVWGRDLVAISRINSGSIFYDNLPNYIQRNLLDKTTGKVNQTLLENMFENKMQQIIDGIVKQRPILKQGIPFNSFPTNTTEEIRKGANLILQKVLQNSFRERTNGNTLQTSSLTITQDLSGWLVSSDMFGTIGFTAIMNSGLHHYKLIKDPNGQFIGLDGSKYNIVFKGNVIAITFKTGELLSDVPIDATDDDSLITRKTMNIELGKAQVQGRAETLQTDVVENMTTNFDTFIKANQSTQHIQGSIVDIEYTGTDTKYINPNVHESYIFDGANYLLVSSNIWERDQMHQFIALFQNDLNQKAEDSVVIKKDGSVEFIAGYTPATPQAPANKQYVDVEAQKVADNIRGNNATKTISDLEAELAHAETRITNIENGGKAIVKGKWEYTGDILPLNATQATDNTSEHSVPLTDDDGATTTWETNDIVFIDVEMCTKYGETNIFAARVKIGATKAAIAGAANYVEKEYATALSFDANGDITLDPNDTSKFIPGAKISAVFDHNSKASDSELVEYFDDSKSLEQSTNKLGIWGTPRTLTVEIKSDKLSVRDDAGNALSGQDLADLQNYQLKKLVQLQPITVDIVMQNNGTITISRTHGSLIDFSKNKIKTVYKEIYSLASGNVSQAELQAEIANRQQADNNKVDDIVPALSQAGLQSNDVIASIIEAFQKAINAKAKTDLIEVSDVPNGPRIITIRTRDNAGYWQLKLDEDDDGTSGVQMLISTPEDTQITIRAQKDGTAYIETQIKGVAGSIETNRINFNDILKLDNILDVNGVITGKEEDLSSANGNYQLRWAADDNGGVIFDMLDKAKDTAVRAQLLDGKFVLTKVNTQSNDVLGTFKPFANIPLDQNTAVKLFSQPGNTDNAYITMEDGLNKYEMHVYWHQGDPLVKWKYTMGEPMSDALKMHFYTKASTSEVWVKIPDNGFNRTLKITSVSFTGTQILEVKNWEEQTGVAGLTEVPPLKLQTRWKEIDPTTFDFTSDGLVGKKVKCLRGSNEEGPTGILSKYGSNLRMSNIGQISSANIDILIWDSANPTKVGLLEIFMIGEQHWTPDYYLNEHMYIEDGKEWK